MAFFSSPSSMSYRSHRSRGVYGSPYAGSVPTHYSAQQPVYYAPSGSSHRSGYYDRHRHHDHYRSPYSFGERVLRFFGFRSHGHRHHRSHHHHHNHRQKGWSFFGSRSRRNRYFDGSTGAEIDKYGRHIYTV